MGESQRREIILERCLPSVIKLYLQLNERNHHIDIGIDINIYTHTYIIQEEKIKKKKHGFSLKAWKTVKTSV